MSNKEKKDSLISFVLNYKLPIFILLFFTLANNASALVIPRLASGILDSFATDSFDPQSSIITFLIIAIAVFIFALVQTALSMVVAERIGMDLRNKIIEKISKQTYSFVNKVTPEKILTNITADVDVIKQFISQSVVLTFTAIVLLIGSSVMLLSINVQLALPILAIVPLMAVIFGFIFSKIRKFFELSQKNVDKLNLIITESIIGASLIRVVTGQKDELTKFTKVNEESRNLGYSVLKLFVVLIPVIELIANLAIVIIIWNGGNQVIDGTLTYGELIAFYTYIGTLVTPVFILGFMSGNIFRAFVSYGRITEVLSADIETKSGHIKKDIKGEIDIKDGYLTIDEKEILKNINLKFNSGTKNAIIGPTASGKTQLFNLITGLLYPTTGEVLVDNTNINDFNKDKLFEQIGLVFQDSIIFNTTIIENITFGEDVDKINLKKAIETAELDEFIDGLEKGLNTNITERGANLSGGQKQRLTLARALVLNPKILLLDDFTARVDKKTEDNILKNLSKNYPDLTLVMITQKIEPVKDFDQIVLLMEGEVISKGKHKELLENSIEYRLIFDSQQSTE